ncbi:AAA-domain-containing protein [Anaeromyces robustus]|uniref:AAA-domain-containing protein n=1 Tax=Anaeromyces robustus TaxID=1754192 RepID=A0A1Y1XDU0_9FUNG|nr:AAA-domain-containing protein [Anaeromyces robustus]|eukprot:ORX83928.1 AAA-domain-containing protein [Anaeromyces robustus]
MNLLTNKPLLITGNGKTKYVENLLKNYNNYEIVIVSLADMLLRYPLNIETCLNNYFEYAYKHQPSILIFDNCEEIFNRNGSNYQFIYNFMDNTKKYQNEIIIIGKSNSLDDIHPIIKNYFEEFIDIQNPDTNNIISIFKNNLNEYEEINSIDLIKIANLCKRFTYNDIIAVCKFIIQNSSNDNLDSINRVLNNNIKNSYDSSVNESIQWDDIGGLDKVKEDIEESVIWYFNNPEAYNRLGIQATKGVLLYGPPGTGKTLLAKAIATKINSRFILINISDLVKGEVGQSEKAIKKFFDLAISTQPAIIFLDELESLFSKRKGDNSIVQKLSSQLILQLDELNSGQYKVIILGATNNVRALDPSITRSGRLDHLIHVPLPDCAQRESILKVIGKRMPISDNVDYKIIAERINGYSGADIKELFRKTGLYALKRIYKLKNENNSVDIVKNISQEDFIHVLNNTKK